MSQKIAIITGGATGIGLETTKRFILEGANIYVLDIKPLSLEQKIDNLHFIECNVADYNQIKKAVDTIFQNEGRIDVLVSNAGVHHIASIEDTSLEDFERVLSVNFKGAFYTLKCVLPIMRKQHYGSIVLTGSDQCFIGKTESAIYGATKGAIGQLTKSTALDYAPYNIRVNCVCPGPILTPLYEKAIIQIMKKFNLTDRDALLRKFKRSIPLKRIGKPKEVANLITFLCSDEASFMTGALVPIDGGYTAS